MKLTLPAMHTLRRLFSQGVIPLLAMLIFTGCAPSPDPALQATKFFQNALLTATFAIRVPSETPAPTVIPTETPIPPSPTSNVPRTPPALPPIFTTGNLNPLDTPHIYIKDACEYLKAKWNPNNSAPGTVVMPIMFHSITDGDVTQPNQVTHGQVVQLLRDLKDQGFEAITTQQLADFLYNNTLIPNRSVILIVDDRHYAEYYQTHFVPQLQEYTWKVVNAWISLPDSISEQALPGNIQLVSEGWIDVQGHGVVHNIPVEDWPAGYTITTPLYGTLPAEEYIKRELSGAAATIEEKFGKRPIGYIWPGGGFSPRAVQLAREAGYQMAFTVNPRGPTMFNWVPLTDIADPARPSYSPEGQVNDPLMVLPRFWDTDAVNYIDTVRQIGKEAKAYAEQNQGVELEYYDIVCKPIIGEIPSKTP